MKIRIIFAIAAARITTFILRLLGRGGTSLPGKTAMLFKRNLLEILSKNIKSVVITGTNGKTTTSRIISEILKNNNVSYFENKSGANLISGITASFAAHSTISGRCRFDYAVIECDEAAFRTVCPILSPDIIVVTNLFRDQLDRYGEITHTRNNILEGITGAPDSVVILNADDSLSYSISGLIKNKTFLYGLNSPPYGIDSDFISDAPYCIKCKTKYDYKFRTYAHLGHFQCPGCGYERPAPDMSADNITLFRDSSEASITINNEEFKTRIALPGAYNIYNALAAVSSSHCLGLNDEIAFKSLSTFKSGFGRMEQLDLNGIDSHMILVKNPAGLNQVINFLSTDETPKVLVLILNDRHADGTDISWIWDVNFEKIKDFTDSLVKIIVSGIRAEELLLRLKYAGLNTDNVILEKDYNSVIDKMTVTENNLPVYILPTYTAMFDFRNSLSKRYKIRKFWK